MTDDTRAEMKKILAEIQTGAFAARVDPGEPGGPAHVQGTAQADRPQHPIEAVGEQLRGMMSWLKKPAPASAAAPKKAGAKKKAK